MRRQPWASDGQGLEDKYPLRRDSSGVPFTASPRGSQWDQAPVALGNHLLMSVGSFPSFAYVLLPFLVLPGIISPVYSLPPNLPLGTPLPGHPTSELQRKSLSPNSPASTFRENSDARW